MPDIALLLNKALAENNLSLPNESIQKLLLYLDLIQTWNHSFNLTAIIEPRKMVYLHIIDSLIIAPFLPGTRILDVGSGAGLPGIPLAILCPEKHWVLLDKNGKKTRFLTQVIAELGLKNATAAYSRCEDFQPDTCFDQIISRAFGTLKLFTETTEHLLCPNGFFVAMKGKYPEEELIELPSRFLVKNVTRLAINGIDVERHVVVVGKT